MRLIFTFLITFGFINFALAQEKNKETQPHYIFSIYFGGGSAYIDEAQIQALYNWLDGIPGVDGHEISIHGHTDNIGSIEYNQWLSQKRCQAAFQELINKGLRPELIRFKDFGELNPIYDNSTWDGQKRNRRVDVIVWPLIL
jgi:OOP family OmpA-OmpF porin